MEQMKYPLIVSQVYHQPWAILPSVYSIILELIRFRAEGNTLSQAEIQARLEAAEHSERRGRHQAGAIAVLPLYGVISHRASMMSDMSGGTSTLQFGDAFGAAIADPAISGIVIDIDSPGGAVAGVQELWNTIMAARGSKPVIAFANSMAASAAYWIAAAADEIIVTPSGEVGSIGVITAHQDISVQAENEGVKTTIISAGKKKADLSPFAPLSDRATADLQARADELYGTFVGAVAKGRSTTPSNVRSGFGEGGMVGAKEAVSIGMADRIGTIDIAIQRAARPGPRAEYTSGFAQITEYHILADDPSAVVTNMATDVNDTVAEEDMIEGTDSLRQDLDLRKRRLALKELTRP